MKHNAMAIDVRTRIIYGVLAIMTMMFSIGGDLMAQTNASTAVKNIVLVHGGFVDGSGWQGVYKALKKNGYNVTVVQNSTTSLGRRRHHKARDCYAGRPRHSRRSLVWRRCHHRSWQRSESGWVGVYRRFRAR